ncbi:MAG: AAA family ATPase, partial [Fusobacteriaceae bacterium]
MANKILCLGNSGTGKSTSIRNLDPATTLIIKVLEKDLPFKGSRSMYNKEAKNTATISDMNKLIVTLDGINKLEHIKTVVIDDANYLLTLSYKDKAKEAGFQKFETLAFNFIDILKKIDSMRFDLNVYLMAHTQKDNDGVISTKTIGKFLDDKLCVEGVFTIVTLSIGADNQYKMIVNGVVPAKSPMGMFESDEIENDLAMINKKIEEY